jgi:hypothetical protein
MNLLDNASGSLGHANRLNIAERGPPVKQQQQQQDAIPLEPNMLEKSLAKERFTGGCRSGRRSYAA